MPYRIDLPHGSENCLDRLIELGALDVERWGDGAITALMPDSVTPQRIADALDVAEVIASPAIGRDAGSVWILRPLGIRVGRLQIVPAHLEAEPGALRLIDTAAFGTGLHPTTALCLETLEELLQTGAPASMLDVGTGSGVLALAALTLGVPRALALDIDDEALGTAAENARINGLSARLQVTRGGPEDIEGTWPLVTANILAAPLIEMAPSLVPRVGLRGRLVLSGIRESLEEDVHRAYRHLGMRHVSVRSRAGWTALVMQASW